MIIKKTKYSSLYLVESKYFFMHSLAIHESRNLKQARHLASMLTCYAMRLLLPHGVSNEVYHDYHFMSIAAMIIFCRIQISCHKSPLLPQMHRVRVLHIYRARCLIYLLLIHLLHRFLQSYHHCLL